jgi:uncharacterized membrane protein YjjP (DUF1212 family)
MGITRMMKVGDLGVNHRLDHELWLWAKRVSRRKLSPEQTRRELTRLAKETPRHSPWMVAISAGVACAAFGRLLDVDWYGTGAILLASTFAQWVRHQLLARRVNPFLCTAFISFQASLLAGLVARWAGSQTVPDAIAASILMLIPGVPALNAQSDILEGHPTLGSARLVTVVMTLIFIVIGLSMGTVLLVRGR